MSNKCVVKAEIYHIIDDVYHSFMPLLQKRPDDVILHVETKMHLPTIHPELSLTYYRY